MRRALLVLLAFPASALAQTAGSINLPSGFTSIDIAQCSGTQNTVLGNDTLTIDLSWNVNPGTNTFSGGTINLYALSQQPGAGQSGGTNTTSCTALSNGDAISPTPTPVPDTDGVLNIIPTGQTMSATFSLQQIVSKASLSCSGGTTSTVYLCIQWSNSSSSTAGFATAQVKLDTTAPAAPSQVTWSPGDGVLHLTASVDSTTTACKAVATSLADSSTHSTGQDACDSLAIDGLANGQDYSVVVYAINQANNPSSASAAITATPFATDDFWTRYKNANGRETGGCSTGAGAAGLLSALGLLAIRRRKP